MVVNASLRSHIIYHDQSGLSHPNQKGEKGEKTNNIHNVVNSKMMEFNHGGGVLMHPMSCGFTWLLMPRRGLT